MSMLIIGVNPPKSCYVCAWYDKVQCPVNDGRYYYRVERHPDCPLVEIPTPHGRLIDAKFVYEICGEKQGRASSIGEMQGISKVWKAVKRLPTVIEAEGSEE